MRLLKLTVLTVLLAMPLSSAAATIVWNNDQTSILGINNILVPLSTGNAYFDAAFDASYNAQNYPTEYLNYNQGLYDSISDLFTSQALDINNLNTYRLINGCASSSTQCFITTLHGQITQLDGYTWSAAVQLNSSGGFGIHQGFGTNLNYGHLQSFVSWSPSVVPEPGTSVLFGLGLAGIGFVRRK